MCVCGVHVQTQTRMNFPKWRWITRALTHSVADQNLMMISETERQDASDELQTSLGDLAAGAADAELLRTSRRCWDNQHTHTAEWAPAEQRLRYLVIWMNFSTSKFAPCPPLPSKSLASAPWKRVVINVAVEWPHLLWATCAHLAHTKPPPSSKSCLEIFCLLLLA